MPLAPAPALDVLSLKQKAVSGIKWQVANNVLQKVISVATFAILARILEPSTFGLFAMAFIAIDGLGLFKTFGLDAGVIQKKGSAEEFNHTAFVIIQLVGLGLFLVCFLSAPLAATFFKNESVAPILKVLGAIFILTGFGRVPAAILTKEMRFQQMSLIDLAGSIVNSVFAILFALISPTVWSLVGAYLIKQVTMTSLTWYFSGYRPRWHFDSKIAGELFHFGKFMIGLSLLWYVGGNLANTIVGKILGVTALGYYALALNIGNFINTHFTYVISRIMFPAYSALQEDRETLKRAYLKTVKFISILSFPYSIALICLAREFVLTLYGSKWQSVIGVLQLMGFTQIVAPLLACSGSVFRSVGKPKYEFNLTLSQIIVYGVLVVALTTRWGLLGTVSAGITSALIFGPINISLVKRVIGFTYGEFFRQLLPSLACSLAMIVCILAIKTLVLLEPFFTFFDVHVPLTFILAASAGILAYFVSFFIVDRPATLEAREMLLGARGA